MNPKTGDGHCMSYNPALLPLLLKGIRMCEDTAGGIIHRKKAVLPVRKNSLFA